MGKLAIPTAKNLVTNLEEHRTAFTNKSLIKAVPKPVARQMVAIAKAAPSIIAWLQKPAAVEMYEQLRNTGEVTTTSRNATTRPKTARAVGA